MPFYRLDTQLWSSDTMSRRRLLNSVHVFTFPVDEPAGGYTQFSVNIEPLGTYTKGLDGISRFLILSSDSLINLTVTDDQVPGQAETISRIRLLTLEKTITQLSVYNPSSTVSVQVNLAFEFKPVL